MTNNNPDPDQGRRRIARPMPQASDFVAPSTPADRSRNGQRGMRSTRRRRFTI